MCCEEREGSVRRSKTVKGGERTHGDLVESCPLTSSHTGPTLEHSQSDSVRDESESLENGRGIFRVQRKLPEARTKGNANGVLRDAALQSNRISDERVHRPDLARRVSEFLRDSLSERDGRNTTCPEAKQ
jgi:hypothetical protein